MKKVLLCLLVLLPAGGALSQNGTVEINGQVMPFTVDECGDTIILANLSEVSVSSPQFETREDVLKYRRYKRYALEVYPYAIEAIRVFRKVEHVTQDMKKRKQRKYVKELQQELKEKFKDPLKDLTKTQGMILFKMIEKELDTPIYDLVKDLRGWFTAAYWNTLGSLYGHKLKDGYQAGKDPILDAVLNDLDVSFDIPEEDMEATTGANTKRDSTKKR